MYDGGEMMYCCGGPSGRRRIGTGDVLKARWWWWWWYWSVCR